MLLANITTMACCLGSGDCVSATNVAGRQIATAPAAAVEAKNSLRFHSSVTIVRLFPAGCIDSQPEPPVRRIRVLLPMTDDDSNVMSPFHPAVGCQDLDHPVDRLITDLELLDRHFPYGSAWSRSRLELLPIVTAAPLPVSSAWRCFAFCSCFEDWLAWLRPFGRPPSNFGIKTKNEA